MLMRANSSVCLLFTTVKVCYQSVNAKELVQVTICHHAMPWAEINRKKLLNLPTVDENNMCYPPELGFMATI